MAEEPRRRRRVSLLEMPGARVNPIHAVQLGFWEIDEAAAFLTGFDRKFMNLDAVDDPLKGTAAAAEFLRVREAIHRAVRIKDLEMLLRPKACVDWALDLGLQVPVELVTAAHSAAQTSEVQPHPEAVAQNLMQTTSQRALTQRLNTSQRINSGLMRKWYNLVPGQATEGEMTGPQKDLKDVGVSVDTRTLFNHLVEGAGLNARRKARRSDLDS